MTADRSTADAAASEAPPTPSPDAGTWRPRGHLVGWAAALLGIAVVVLGTSFDAFPNRPVLGWAREVAQGACNP